MEKNMQPNDSLNDTQLRTIAYRQVFQDKTGFLAGLSSLDLLFCEGRNAGNLLFNKS
jgi:hypothetical protein